jgi:MerR family transcriptional regulator, light-induced transcriptional regulator
MRTLRTSEAAALLSVSPNTLRAWERRFGYPQPRRTRGKHREYVYAEIVSLREALEEGLSISSAVSVAREAFGADTHALLSALTSFRAAGADDAMEGSLCLRSIERSVEEVLLPALTEIRRRRGVASAVWAFSASWGDGWLERARRLAPVASRRAGVLIGDASAAETDPTRPFVRAFELSLLRSGLEVLRLPVSASRRVSEAVAAIDPDVVVIAGGHAGDEEVARWAYGVRSCTRRVQFLLFHRGLDPLNAGSRTRILAVSPMRANEEVLHALAATSGRSAPEAALEDLVPPAFANHPER